MGRSGCSASPVYATPGTDRRIHRSVVGVVEPRFRREAEHLTGCAPPYHNLRPIQRSRAQWPHTSTSMLLEPGTPNICCSGLNGSSNPTNGNRGPSNVAADLLRYVTIFLVDLEGAPLPRVHGARLPGMPPLRLEHRHRDAVNRDHIKSIPASPQLRRRPSRESEASGSAGRARLGGPEHLLLDPRGQVPRHLACASPACPECSALRSGPARTRGQLTPASERGTLDAAPLAGRS